MKKKPKSKILVDLKQSLDIFRAAYISQAIETNKPVIVSHWASLYPSYKNLALVVAMPDGSVESFNKVVPTK